MRWEQMDSVIFHQSKCRNGKPPYDLAYPERLHRPIFTCTRVKTNWQRRSTATEFQRRANPFFFFFNQEGSLIVKSWSVVSYPVLSSHCSHCSLPVLSQQMAEQLMTLAYENGINLFDTAEVYAAGKWVDLVPAIIYKWAVKANIIKLPTWEWLLKAPCTGCAPDAACLRVTGYM